MRMSGYLNAESLRNSWQLASIRGKAPIGYHSHACRACEKALNIIRENYNQRPSDHSVGHS